jgi:hypothetical protein
MKDEKPGEQLPAFIHPSSFRLHPYASLTNGELQERI